MGHLTAEEVRRRRVGQLVGRLTHRGAPMATIDPLSIERGSLLGGVAGTARGGRKRDYPMLEIPESPTGGEAAPRLGATVLCRDHGRTDHVKEATS